LDPSYPTERLRLLAADAGLAVLLTGSRLADRFAGVPVPLLLLDREAGAIARRPAGGPLPLARPENLAYVMYTSGSTGVPKGVAVTHRNVVRLVRETNYASFAPDEVFLQLAPLSFDAATWEVWGPLLNGGRLEVFPAHVPTLEELASFLAERRVTSLWLTAGLFHQMAERHAESLRSVRWVLTGGDVVSPPHAARALEAMEGILANGYGPTEGTTFTTWYPVPRGGAAAGPLSIGRPIANTRVHVLDRRLQPVPVGVPGELLVGGDGLARGYLGRPDLTAERFVPDPLASEPGGRIYRTGDLARWRPDGTLDFLGRLDDQVKIRGFRVEPGEVEAALAGHPAVREAAVAVRPDPAGGRRLVAYVALEEGGTVRAVREDLRRGLPEPMVPAVFVELPALPLNANGKVDRKALPEPERTAEENAYEAPRTPTEERLAAIWAELLGAGRVGIHDDFFDLGGHSLLATRVASRVREDFGVELPLRALFEAPTVASLAARIEEAGATELPPLVRVPRDADLPVSFAQERLWFLDQLEPGNASYNIWAALSLRGPLSVPALARALGEVVCR
ncbi:MAG TPA: amino acid adenylation domain-containing protein, partial [Thermoanaerobaculia bacterium]|nr:amino acid adenylation domain-containing protein [Thermoanaerobaculia bacterium]